MASSATIARYYSRMRLETATHPRVIWMLHAKCVQLIRQSGQIDPLHRRNLIVRAQNILAELEGSLKVTDEVAKGLFYLYDYCYCLLETDDPKDLALALQVLMPLADTFSLLLKKRS